jgi:hypothetical protein
MKIEQRNGSVAVRLEYNSIYIWELTLGLKVNSTTVLGSSVILFGENIRVLSAPTLMVVLRSPPIGSPSGGVVVGDDLFAAI